MGEYRAPRVPMKGAMIHRPAKPDRLGENVGSSASAARSSPHPNALKMIECRTVYIFLSGH